MSELACRCGSTEVYERRVTAGPETGSRLSCSGCGRFIAYRWDNGKRPRRDIDQPRFSFSSEFQKTVSAARGDP